MSDVTLKIDANTKGVEDGAKRAGDALEGLADSAKGAGDGATGIGGALGEIASTQKLQALADAGRTLEDIGNRVGALADRFFAAGKQLDELKDTIGTFTPAGNVDAVADSIRAMSVELALPAQEIADAQQRLAVFGVTGEDTVRRVADAATVSGKSIGEVTETVAQFLSGNERGAMMMEKMLNIDSRALAEFGAVIGSNNKVLLDTPAHVDAARAALEGLMDARFGGATKQTVDAFEQLDIAVQQANENIGEHTMAVKNAVASAILPMVEALKEAPGWMQATVGAGTEVVGTMGSLAGGALQVGANLKLMGVTAAGAGAAAKSAMMALASPLGLATIAVAGALVGIHLYTEEVKKATAAEEELLAIEERRAQWGRENKDLIGKTAEQVLAMGKNEKDVAQEIQHLHELAQTARANENKEQEAQYVSQIDHLQRVKVELSERAAKETQVAGLSTATWEDYSKRVSAGFFETKAAQLQALDAVIAAQKKAGEDSSEAELSRVSLARQVADEQKKVAEDASDQVRKAAEDKLAAELHALQVEEAAGQVSAAQKAARLQDILRRYQDTAVGRDKLRSVEVEAARAEGQVAKQAEDDEKKREAEREKRQQKREADAAKLLARRLQDIDTERAKEASTRDLSTQDEIAYQQRIVALYRQGTSERAQAEIALFNLKARLRQEDEAAQQRLRALDSELANARTDEVDDQIADLQDKMQVEQEAGRSTEAITQQIVALMREKLAIQQQIIDATTKEKVEAEKDPRVKEKLQQVGEKQKADAARDSDREIRRVQRDQTKRAQDLAKANQDVAQSYRNAGDAAKAAGGWHSNSHLPDAQTSTIDVTEFGYGGVGGYVPRSKRRKAGQAGDASDSSAQSVVATSPAGAAPAAAAALPANTITKEQGDQVVSLLGQIATNTKTQAAGVGQSTGNGLASRLAEASYFSAG